MEKFNFKYGLFLILVIYISINLIFQYLINVKKIKTSKLSRIFYIDDEIFIMSWEKVKKEGMLRYTIKTTSTHIIIMGIIGIVFKMNKISMFGYEQRQTILIALIIGAILGIINAVIDWGINCNRYVNLKDKKDNGD